MGQRLKDEIESYLKAGGIGTFAVPLDSERLEESKRSNQGSETKTDQGVEAFFKAYGCETPSENDFRKIGETLGSQGDTGFKNDCMEVIAFGLWVSTRNITAPDNSWWKKISRGRKFKARIRPLEQRGLLRAPRREKVRGRRAFLEMIAALHLKWSLRKDEEPWVFYDGENDCYDGCFFDAACNINKTISKISGCKFAPYATYDALGKDLQRFIKSRQFWKSVVSEQKGGKVVSPIAFGVETFAKPGEQQRRSLEGKWREIPANERTEQGITEIIRTDPPLLRDALLPKRRLKKL